MDRSGSLGSGVVMCASALLLMALPAAALGGGLTFHGQMPFVAEWSAQRVLVARTGGWQDPCCDVWRWHVLDEQLAPIAYLEASDLEVKTAFDEGERARLPPEVREIIEDLARRAAAKSAQATAEAAHVAFDDAFERMLGSVGGLRPLDECPDGLSFAPCQVPVWTPGFACGPVLLDQGEWSGCLRLAGGDIVALETSETIGITLHRMRIGPCTRCRQGIVGREPRTPQRWGVVPVLPIPAGNEGAPFEAVGFTPSGELVFSVPGAMGAREIHRYDPVRGEIQPGAPAGGPLAPISDDDRIAPLQPFSMGGDVLTLTMVPWLEYRDAGSKPPRTSGLRSILWSRTRGHSEAVMIDLRRPGEQAASGRVALVAALRVPAQDRIVLVAYGAWAAAPGEGDLSFASLYLPEITFEAWRTPESPAAVTDASHPWGIRFPDRRFVTTVHGFSENGRFGYAADRGAPAERLRIVDLVRDEVVFRGQVEDAPRELAKAGIRAFPAPLARGWVRAPIPLPTGTYRISERRGEIVLAREGPPGERTEKVIARIPQDRRDAVRKALRAAVWIASPFEPRLAVIVPMPDRDLVIGAHLLTGLDPQPGRTR